LRRRPTGRLHLLTGRFHESAFSLQRTFIPTQFSGPLLRSISGRDPLFVLGSILVLRSAPFGQAVSFQEAGTAPTCLSVQAPLMQAGEFTALPLNSQPPPVNSVAPTSGMEGR